jgi:RNA polymerase sigma-70 factor (ECF subfamily)
LENLGTLERARLESWTDQEIIARVRAGDTGLYEIIMRRYNLRLYRVTRAILRDESEAEDVIQDAYVRAYQHLDQFAGNAPFSVWLTRIAVHEALRRLQQRKRSQQFEETGQDEDGFMNSSRTSTADAGIAETSPDPEQRAAIAELGKLLEEAVLDLPTPYRTVIMLRDIEELSTAETAAALELTEENVKVRLHRGRALMRDHLFARVGPSCKSAFPFMGANCDRVVLGVFGRLRELNSEP